MSKVMEFKHVTTNERNGIEIFARFTGYHDCIQYKFVKDGEQIGDIMVTTMSELLMKNEMLDQLRGEFLLMGLKCDETYTSLPYTHASDYIK